MNPGETEGIDTDEAETVDPSSELFYHHSDSGNYSLSTVELNAENYNQWQRSAQISLIAKNKLGFVKGTCEKPKSGSKVSLWERCDNLVIYWLLHSVEPEIANSIMYCNISCEIWKELTNRYGQ